MVEVMVGRRYGTTSEKGHIVQVCLNHGLGGDCVMKGAIATESLAIHVVVEDLGLRNFITC